MAKRTRGKKAAVGAVEYGNRMLLVTVDANDELLDRRDVALTEPGTPTHPHHHEGSWAVGRYLSSPWARRVTLPEALALVHQVEQAARRGAAEVLEGLIETIGVSRAVIAIRVCQRLPAGIEATIRDPRAQTYADSVMYRRALADASEARGWTVYWYQPVSLGRMKSRVDAIGEHAGRPWTAKHKQAAAAALRALEQR